MAVALTTKNCYKWATFMARPRTFRLTIVAHVVVLVAVAVLAGCVGGPSPGGPATAGAPTEDGVTFDTVTPPDDPLAFVPNAFSAAPGVEITVNYLNDSQLPHNIRFFAGPDPNGPTIAATEIVTGPDNLQTVAFTAPDSPGDYFFHCDVHPQVMQGTLTVQA